MPSAKVYDMAGKVVREHTLDDYVFGAPLNEALVHQVMTAQLINRRQGTASTKTRAFVSGGNSKPYRQKGTGRARQGSTRAPHYRGGGTVFGPKPHPYEAAVPRKMKRLALRTVLSDKVSSGKMLLVEKLSLEEGKTREMEKFLDTLPIETHVLILLPTRDEQLLRAGHNIHRAKLGHVDSINVVELLKYDVLLLPMQTVDSIVDRFGQAADDKIQAKRHPRVVERRLARAKAGAKTAKE
jgi:large subunit ribosomal protein L4